MHPVVLLEGRVVHPVVLLQGRVVHPVVLLEGRITHPVVLLEGRIVHPVVLLEGRITHPHMAMLYVLVASCTWLCCMCWLHRAHGYAVCAGCMRPLMPLVAT